MLYTSLFLNDQSKIKHIDGFEYFYNHKYEKIKGNYIFRQKKSAILELKKLAGS